MESQQQCNSSASKAAVESGASEEDGRAAAKPCLLLCASRKLKWNYIWSEKWIGHKLLWNSSCTKLEMEKQWATVSFHNVETLLGMQTDSWKCKSLCSSHNFWLNQPHSCECHSVFWNTDSVLLRLFFPSFHTLCKTHRRMIWLLKAGVASYQAAMAETGWANVC